MAPKARRMITMTTHRDLPVSEWRAVGRGSAGDLTVHALAVALASWVTYWLATHGLPHIHAVSKPDTLIGGLWAVIATLFVYRTSYDESATSALSRMAATLVSFAVALIYLLLAPFHPWGLALVIAVATVVPALIGRPQDAVTSAITAAVIVGVTAVNPHHAWEQPIMRLADTALGVAIGVSAAWAARRLAPRGRRLKRPARQPPHRPATPG
jgi:uncharacterized membrane protein YgaE (UPF0421/DUF939 family)